MRVWGLGDLHLSFQGPVDPENWQDVSISKPMDIFGPFWDRHYEKIYRSWQETVGEDDLVLVPGDISWAIDLEGARFDLSFLGMLSGKLLIIRGNHDYWWKSISQVRAALPGNVRALQNDAFIVGSTAFCGTRGWLCPNKDNFSEHDEKIYQREVNRLSLSLKEGAKKAERIVVLIHYRPTNDNHDYNDFIALMQEHGVTDCVYGHLHEDDHKKRLPEEKWGIRFHLVSADFLNFKPVLVTEI